MAGVNSLPSTVNQATSSLTSGQETSSHGTRARHTTTAGPSTAAAATADPTRQQAINNMATQLQHYFPGGSGMNEIVQDRARELHDMGETPASVAENMGKAQKMDYISEAFGGALKAFPFAISGYASGAIKLGAGVAGSSVGSEALAGAIDGATAMVLKSVGDKVFANTVKDTLWLAADAEKLEPGMQEVLKKRQGLGESLKLAPLGGQGFNGRNAVVGTVATLTHNNPQAISHTSNLLSLTAGSAGGVLTNKFSASHGPEYLLGRTDWKAQYTALKATTVKQQMTSGGAERLKTLLLSLMTPRDYAKGALNILSGNMVSEIGTLAVSLAGNNALRNVVRNPGVGGAVSSAPSAAIDEAIGRLGAGELTSPTEIAKDQAINLVGAALAYAAQGVAGALAGPAPTRNDEAVDFVADKVVNSLAGQKTGEIRDKSVDALQSGAKAVKEGAPVLARYAKHEGKALLDATGNSIGSNYNSMKQGASDMVTNAHQWAAEQLRQQFAAPSQPAQAMPASSGQPVGQPTVQAATTQASTLARPQPTAQASTSQPAAQVRPQPTVQASTSQPAAQIRPQPQASTSQPAAQGRPQPTAQARTSQATTQAKAQPAAQASTSQTTAPAGSQPTVQASTSRPAGEEIEMQPMGKSKQA